MTIYGINTVLEALQAGRVREVRVGGRGDARLQRLLNLAKSRDVPVRRVSTAVLDRDARNGVHQGVVADVDSPSAHTVEELVQGATGPALIVVLDGIEDPHNLGAILRTADAAGVDGVVIQRCRSAARGGVAAKASAGALVHVRVAEVVNLARAIGEMKSIGLWIVGLSAGASAAYDAVDLTMPTALVLGAEGTGLRRLVREACDHLVEIPMQGRVNSLNVSVAAGIALFEVLRQRR